MHACMHAHNFMAIIQINLC